MTSSATPDVIVYLCDNCVPEGIRVPRQWMQEGGHVLVRRVPCSGKMDCQYLLHAFEGGIRGLCIAACPKGDCRLAQGNYRAEVRAGTVRRLLGEIGIEPGRVELLHVSPNDPPGRIEDLLRDAVRRISLFGNIAPSAEGKKRAAVVKTKVPAL